MGWDEEEEEEEEEGKPYGKTKPGRKYGELVDLEERGISRHFDEDALEERFNDELLEREEALGIEDDDERLEEEAFGFWDNDGGRLLKERALGNEDDVVDWLEGDRRGSECFFKKDGAMLIDGVSEDVAAAEIS